MKKVFALWAALLGLVLAVVTHVPLHANLVMAPTSAGAPPTCSQGDTVIGRLSGMDSTHNAAYEAMICGLVNDLGLNGNFTTTGCGAITVNPAGASPGIDVLYLFATDTQAHALVNLCGNSFTGTIFPTTMNFTANAGIAANASATGTSGPGVDSNFVPASAGGHYQLNSASLGMVILTAATDTVANDAGGGDAGSVHFSIIQARTGSNAWLCALNYDTATTYPQTTVATSAGFHLCNRSASNALQGYINATQIGTGATVSSTLASTSLGFVGFSSGSSSQISAHQNAAAIIASGLSAANVSAIDSRICAAILALHGSAPC